MVQEEFVAALLYLRQHAGLGKLREVDGGGLALRYAGVHEVSDSAVRLLEDGPHHVVQR